MRLFEIDAKFYELFDEETGEILDEEALEALEIERNEKVRNIICVYKKLVAEAEALKNAKLELAKRQSAKEKSAEWLLKYLDKSQAGNPFECTEGKLLYRKSTTTEMLDETAFLEWEGRWEYGKSEFKASKEDIGNAIKNGKKIPGWIQVEHNNPSIK